MVTSVSQQRGPAGGQFGGQFVGQFGGQPGPRPGPPGRWSTQPGQGWNAPGYRPQPGHFGPQHQPPGGPGGPPAPRRNPLGRVLGVLVVLALVALAGLVITNLTGGSSDVAYQNDNYQPPPPDSDPPALPEPETYAEAKQLVTANAFYQQTTPLPVRCELDPINVKTASDAQLKTHFESLMGCLMRVWNPPVKAAGYVLVRPTVTIYSSSVKTKCGDSGINAFYCGADQQVYFSNKLAQGVPEVTRTPRGPDLVMAHEFGHALQARTAILISAKALGQQSDDEATDLQYSRGLETQADCFSGMFLRATAQSLQVQQSDVAAIEATYVAIGDDTLSGKPNIVGNHGHGATRLYWGKVGLASSQVGKCNTFTASPSLTR